MAPSFSKDFQGNSKLFQIFPRISKLFPWPFRGKSRGCRSVEPESRLLQFLRRLGRGERPDVRRRTRSRFNIAGIRIIGKKLSAAISGRGLGASAASHAPTRKPTAATPAPCNFGGSVCDGEGRGGSGREGPAPTAGREIGQFVSCPRKPPVNPCPRNPVPVIPIPYEK